LTFSKPEVALSCSFNATVINESFTSIYWD
jgi:hypothetical protein